MIAIGSENCVYVETTLGHDMKGANTTRMLYVDMLCHHHLCAFLNV